MRNLFLFIIITTISCTLFSQKVITIKNIKGSYTLPPKSDISLKTAFEKAVNEAKLEALRKAGVAENIASSDILTTNQTGDNFKQDMNSILSVELSGAILNDTVIEQKTTNDKFGNIVVDVVINADVIKYEHLSDPAFDFKVEGLKEYFENNNLMKFSFLPQADGYLKIFNVNDAENFLMYPYKDNENAQLSDELNYQFKSSQALQFPLNKNMGNPATKEEGYMLYTELARENNYLIFVYTKENIAFIEKPTYKNILSWIYKITPDKRKVQFFDFVIVNKEVKQ
jgi:hypothetical protein